VSLITYQRPVLRRLACETADPVAEYISPSSLDAGELNYGDKPVYVLLDAECAASVVPDRAASAAAAGLAWLLQLVLTRSTASARCTARDVARLLST